MGCTDLEACLYADIHPASLYNYQNANPDYIERKEALKKNPFMKARMTITGDLKEVDTAKWLLENYDGQAKRGGNQTNTQVNVFAGLREKYVKKNTPPIEDVTVEQNG
jgi:hypothetical protein